MRRPTIQLLVVARLLPQGLAAGLLTPQNSGLIQNLFTGAERPGAFGMCGTTIGMSTRRAPLAGGHDPGFDGRLALDPFVNLPIGIVALVLAARLIRACPAPGAGTGRSTGSAPGSWAVPCSRCCRTVTQNAIFRGHQNLMPAALSRRRCCRTAVSIASVVMRSPHTLAAVSPCSSSASASSRPIAAL